jgi:hypothetical protein
MEEIRLILRKDKRERASKSKFRTLGIEAEMNFFLSFAEARQEKRSP